MEEKEVKTFEENVHGVGKWIAKNLSGIFAVLISVFFIFTGVIKVLPTELSWKEQTIMVFITIVAGWSITSLIGEYGFTSAKGTREYRETKDEYEKSVKGALKHREPIEELAKERASMNLHNARIEILESANICYDDVFNLDGTLNTNFDVTIYKNESFRNYKIKCRAYRQAVKLRVQPMNIFGQASSSTFGLKKEVTEKEFRTRTGAKKFITKVLLSIASVGVMFEFIGWSVGAMIYAFMQVCLWVGMGLIDRQKNFNFVMDVLVPRTKDYTNIILEFEAFPREVQEKYIGIVKRKHEPIKMIEMKEPILGGC